MKSVELGLVEKPGIRLSAKHKGDVRNDSDLRGVKQNHMGLGSLASDVHMHDAMMVRTHNSSCVSGTKLSSKKTSSTKSDVKKKLAESSTNLKHASMLGEKADESSSRNTGEGADENQNQLSVSGNSESDHRTISEVRGMAGANSQASSDAEITPINRDLPSSLELSDAAASEVCRKDIIHNSSLHPSIENDTEYAIRKQNSPTSSAPSSTGKPDLNQSHTPDDVKGVEGNKDSSSLLFV